MIKASDCAEFIGQIIDLFEDFLEEKGIVIPNPEKDDDEDPAIIYGSDYGVLQDGIEEALKNWRLLSPPSSDCVRAAEKILIDNGIDQDEADTVLQAVGYAFDLELYEGREK